MGTIKASETATDPAGPARRLAQAPSKVARGQMIGRFIVIDQLGAGAGGIVVSAYDPDLDRKVALKVLRPEHLYSGSVGRARERLLREAKAVARVVHPNIITVHEVGSVGDQVFVAMEYVEGGTLRDTLSLRKRDWRQVLGLLVPAAKGLAAAHAAGMVHRDFKPANVLVGRDNRVVVSDFGLVSTNQDDDVPGGASEPVRRHHDPSLTDTGTTLGTPAYMAPEQHRGAAVDARSDQFAFCVTLFEALYGVRPFTGNTLLELMTAKENGDVAGPSSNPVPAWLKQIVSRGLAPTPEGRYPSMAELIAEVEFHQRRPARRGWIGLAAVAVAIPVALLAYRSLTTQPVAIDDTELTALKAVVADKDDELKKTLRELKELRGRPKVDPTSVAALEVRVVELEAEVERLLGQLRDTAVARPTKSKSPFARPNLKAAASFELPDRQEVGPPLPKTPEPEIVSSVFAGLRPAISRCAGIPDLGRERSFEEWQRVMDRPLDTELNVSLTIEPNGRAREVRVKASSAGVRTCIALAVRRARFPISTDGGPARYRYSLID